jgi:hypothetical protein
LGLILGMRDDYNSSGADQPLESVKYYNMGKNGVNEIIMAVTPPIYLGDSGLFFFEKDGDNYKLMEKVTTAGLYTTESKTGYLLSKKITSIDANTYYNNLVGPETISYRGLELQISSFYPSEIFDNKDGRMTFLAILNSGDLYLSQQLVWGPAGPQFYLREYTLKLPSGLFARYRSQKYNFITSDSVPAIVWNDGSKNIDRYRTDAHLVSCSTFGAYAVSTTDVSQDVIATGTTSAGEKIYEFKDKNNPIVVSFYDDYSGEWNNDTQSFDKISLSEWFLKHPVILYKNALGEYEIFTNEKYGVAAECGKPVIYLYPVEPTNIRVYVGANIKKSEPTYNNGWRVVAYPDGTLINSDNKKYDSLFWEGMGLGTYPEIKEGFVVEHDKIKAALLSQLGELGLTEKESNDFMEFWLPRMPETPYIRLTWFTTQQMDQLAPLNVFPKPDTVIRVFLDFRGLKNDYNIHPQKLESLPRKGFTLVEWGGLLRQ